MEDHSQAYFVWKQADIKSAWCWHVDAHLDIGRDGLDDSALARLYPAQQPIPELTGNPYVPAVVAAADGDLTPRAQADRRIRIHRFTTAPILDATVTS